MKSAPTKTESQKFFAAGFPTLVGVRPVAHIFRAIPPLVTKSPLDRLANTCYRKLQGVSFAPQTPFSPQSIPASPQFVLGPLAFVLSPTAHTVIALHGSKASQEDLTHDHACPAIMVSGKQDEPQFQPNQGCQITASAYGLTKKDTQALEGTEHHQGFLGRQPQAHKKAEIHTCPAAVSLRLSNVLAQSCQIQEVVSHG